MGGIPNKLAFGRMYKELLPTSRPSQDVFTCIDVSQDVDVWGFSQDVFWPSQDVLGPSQDVGVFAPSQDVFGLSLDVSWISQDVL